MINKSEIKDAVDSAEIAYLECWDFLIKIKEGNIFDAKPVSIQTFQPRLGEALARLSSLHREIEKEKEKSILRNRLRKTKQSVVRLRFLAKQQMVLAQAISVGKTIGDGFAWFFYREDRQYLAKHLTEQEQLHVPSGIGGFAELEFMRSVPSIAGYFCLYHSITSILRLGDVTLVDLKELRVAAIGEIKSGIPRDGKLVVSLYISTPKFVAQDFEANIRPSAEPKTDDIVREGLSQRAKDRLGRQMERISASYTQLRSTPDGHLAFEMDGHIDLLEQVVITTMRRGSSLERVGGGLLVFGLRQSHASLYKRLSSRTIPSLNKKLAGIEAQVTELLVGNRTDNSLTVATAIYDSDGRTHHKPGMTHPIWWPMSMINLQRLVFAEVSVFTIFNPAPLMATLETEGFQVEEIAERHFRVTKEIDGYRFVAEGMSHYFEMIQHYFMSEGSVVNLLKEADAEIKRQRKGHSTPQRIDLLIEQRFGKLQKIQSALPDA
ncbi:hypothetical protein NU688_26210 [Variovorax sp. ZS18.2.2]|uniref:hypothetical protein n=1 Tax=Variovorax sp. ZS18.2.2 TaxID=2971255 RepID=UPI0021509707|nr:hypothetical protein [Variovorax sp. ZS18.2.2]MCR6479677.1 hypothetical protein [Variovorax sp. ZS18.2.2]